MSETDARIRDLIRDYINHLHNEREYLRGVFAVTDARTLATILLEMLECGERQRVLEAKLFLVDAVTRNISPEFNAWLPQSGIYLALRTLLYGPDHNLRHNAIHTIGRMGPRRNARFLIDAFPTYLERYPLELPDLLTELFWLSPTHSRRRWEYFELVAVSPHYLMRWSLFESAYKYGDRSFRTPSSERLERLSMQLADDVHEFVRAEATYELALLRHRWEGQTMPPDEYRRRKRQLQEAVPRLTFSGFSTNVSNYLHAAGKSDYDFDMLDEFVGYRLDHPITAPFDNTADARAFEAWRDRFQRPVGPLTS